MAVDIDAIMKSEDELIEKLLGVSMETTGRDVNHLQLTCSLCGKNKNGSKSIPQRDLKRWEGECSGETKISRVKSTCECGIETNRRNENIKVRKRVSNVSKNEFASNKDFISHNIKTCDTFRYRDALSNQRSSSFIHYKNPGEYVDQYRASKFEKLEQSSYQLDQSIFNDELVRSLSNSFSKLMGNVTLDGQLSIDQAAGLLQHARSEFRLQDSRPKMKMTSSVNHGVLGDLGIHNLQRSSQLKSLDLCMNCGDHVKHQDLLVSLNRGLKNDADRGLRFSPVERFDEKKTKKLSKRGTDQRTRLVPEKPSTELVVDQSHAPDLQPLCQQMPIQIEKRSTFKKDGWRGHPASTKPKFSPGLSSSTLENQNEKRSIRNSEKRSLEYTDIFSISGEKFHYTEGVNLR